MPIFRKKESEWEKLNHYYREQMEAKKRQREAEQAARDQEEREIKARSQAQLKCAKCGKGSAGPVLVRANDEWSEDFWDYNRAENLVECYDCKMLFCNSIHAKHVDGIIKLMYTYQIVGAWLCDDDAR